MSTERAWLVVGMLAVIAMVTRTVGPLATGGKAIGPRARRVIALLPAALLAALVTTGAFVRGSSLTVDARTAGLVIALILVLRRTGVVTVIVAAAAATALFRLAGL